MDISATTNIYGIFGHPVSHSLSPIMHNRAFEGLGLDCVYLGFDIEPGSLTSAVNAIKTLNLKGINITIPHKEAMVNQLDDLTEPVILTGAVNTIKNENGRLVGYNTDVPGVMRAIKEEFNFDPQYKNAFIVGAGGASRAVIAGMCLNGARQIVIANRTLSKADILKKRFTDQYQNVVFSTVSLNDQEKIKRLLPESNIIVNASSAGMVDIPPLELPLETVPKDCPVYDLVYNPIVSPLVRQAREFGLKAESGLGMLLYQGVEAFEIWTGKKAPVDSMREVLLGSR